jgi:hypothetical protein
MQNRGVLDAIRAAREHAAEGRKALVEASPQALERCAEALRAAIAGLNRRRSAPVGGEPSDPVRREALRLQTDLRLLTRLLEHAAEYHAGWLGFAGSACAGYTGSGAAAEVPRRGRLLTQG